MEIPVSVDREPVSGANPRHAVWIGDHDRGPFRKITAANPGEEVINVEGSLYRHTCEIAPHRAWVYTKVAA